MTISHGTNLTGVKEKNRALALKLISTGQCISRVNLARNMHLTKTTLGNIVSDLIANNIIQEYVSPPSSTDSDAIPGRKPIVLDLSPRSPLIMGMLIKRNLLSAILADLKGRVLRQIDHEYREMDQDTLIRTLYSLYEQLRDQQERNIIAIGVSSLGPVDTVNHKLLNPANFWGIHDLDIPNILSSYTGLPTFLIHDSSAGALAEKIYSETAQSLDNFLYLHIMNGIGAGYILKGQLYDGDSGHSGELGHTSINFTGPKCTCGNQGCLELYANLESMNRHIDRLRRIYRGSTSLKRFPANYSWNEIMAACASGDFLASAAIDEFCEYLSYALRNAINLLDITHIIVGYDSPLPTAAVENALSAKLNSGSYFHEHNIQVIKSHFGSRAPLIGSIAVVTNKIFNGELNLI